MEKKERSLEKYDEKRKEFKGSRNEGREEGRMLRKKGGKDEGRGDRKSR